MAELLLELFSEEIPAGMQGKAASDLASAVCSRLTDAGFEGFSNKFFYTPRRITVVITDLETVSPDVSEERKGPRTSAPDKALEGFLRSVGMTKDQLEVQSDKKGDFYVAKIESKGRPTSDVIAEGIPEIVKSFHWPKSMRWGAGSLRWVRPLHSILCVLDGAVVPFDVDGIQSGNMTQGHRFMGPDSFEVSSFEDYAAKLKDAYVMLGAADRREVILTDAKKLCEADGYELIEDEGLLREAAGLVEWPVMMLGSIDDNFVKPIEEGGLPPEVLITSMAKHQKYFAVRDPKTGGLAPRFVVASNLIAEDGGKQIIAGNERVLRARLSDGKFFWDQDRKTKLADRVDDLEDIIFHAKLGTLKEKVDRVKALAETIAKEIGADEKLAGRAAVLAKADLGTDMVGEFADLQGLMGRYYATADGEAPEVAAAVQEHYSPLGPTDKCPSAPVSVSVAMADKVFTLTCFWSIDEKPTGSKDPFALRRAALSVIRLILENKLRVSLIELFDLEKPMRSESGMHGYKSIKWGGRNDNVREDWVNLLSFFADRLKVYLKDRGIKHDLIDAVFALEGQDDLVLIVSRINALKDFLDSEDGANLLTAYKRAANILRIEEKKDKASYRGEADAASFQDAEEHALHEAISSTIPAALAAADSEDFTRAMGELANLRGPVDAFFDKVTVNAEEAEIRKNRLHLLSQIVTALETVADFSKLEG